MTAVRHWHITRDIKPRGECAACDVSWALMDDAERSARSEEDRRLQELIDEDDAEAQAHEKLGREMRIEDTCCGKCQGNTCYVDQITGA